MKLLKLAMRDGRIFARLFDEDKLVTEVDFKPGAKTAPAKLAKLAGSPITDILDDFVADPGDAEVEYPIDEVPPQSHTLRVRSKFGPVDSARSYTGTDLPALLRTVLDDASLTLAEPLLFWDGSTTLCMLDVDYHGQHRPNPDQVELWAMQLKPTPVAFHLSHGGGLHAFYTARSQFTADELAAAAAVHWMQHDPLGEVELKTTAAHPRYTRKGRQAGQVYYFSPGSTDLPSISSWVHGSVTESQILDYLDEREWRFNQRLEHIHCPIDPRPTHSDTPVVPLDQGIYCHVCDAKGYRIGSGRPGFVSWSYILKAEHPPIAEMVRRFTHYDHAKHILKAHVPLKQERILSLGYSALLKLHHGADPRISKVFTAGKDMIRTSLGWVNPQNNKAWSTKIAPMIAQLPSTQFINEKGEIKVDQALVSRFNEDQPIDGYPLIEPLHGCRIYSQRLSIRHPYTYVITPEMYASHPVRYLDRTKRIPFDDCKDQINAIFPGIDFNYLTFLIAMKGCIEGDTATYPFLICTGPSSSGKSTTVPIAASIVADICTDVIFSQDIARFRQSIMTANRAGQYATVNEIFKEADRERLSAISAMTTVLNLTPASVSHEMYVGPRQLGRLPAIIFTDTSIPEAVCNDVQIGRRVFYHALDSRISWEESMYRHHVSSPSNLRNVFPELCDSFLSTIIDTYFSDPIRLPEIAKALGITTLEQSEDRLDSTASLLEFFKAVCLAEDKPLANRKGKGYILLQTKNTGRLRDAWDEIADSRSGDGWFSSRRSGEVDWAKIVGADEPVRLKTSRYGAGGILFRFYQGSTQNPTAVNGEINCVANKGLTDGTLEQHTCIS